nr:hypothetical protein [Tanacetum cinerariifolium]
VVLLNVSSLVEAELDYEKGGYYEIKRKDEEEEMLDDLILSLRHVKKLQIGYNCLTTLSCFEAKGFTFPSNLKHLDWPDYGYDSSGTWLDQLENPSPLKINVKGLIHTPCKKAEGPLEAVYLPSGRGKAVYILPPPLPSGRQYWIPLSFLYARKNLVRLSCGFVLELLRMKLLS